MVIAGAHRPIILYTFKGLFVVALPTFVTVTVANIAIFYALIILFIY